MSDEWTHIRGFKPFLSMWYDAVDEILTETDETKLANDIKLFTILRSVMLAPEKPVFVRSNKLTDLNKIPDFQHINRPNRNLARITWVPKMGPSNYGRRPFHVAPNIPSPISYFSVRDTKMFEKSDQATIRNNCVFRQEGLFTTPAHKVFTVINRDFTTEVDEPYVLYPVSEQIMNMVATNQRNRINLQTFKELTAKMYTKLQEKQRK